MIKKESMRIISTSIIALDTIEMTLENKSISQMASPGQFLHILLDAKTLRRPISIADVDRETGAVTILFKVVGSGTKQLASYQAGMELDVLGPAGNGFQIAESDRAVLLIGGGIGVPPMYYLGKTLAKQNKTVIAVLGFQTEANVFYEEKFKQLGDTFIVTNDGSYGDEGFVTDVFHKVGDFDRYYSCGPLPMLKAVTTRLDRTPGYISLEERMGCGVGACFACVIKTKDDKGYKKICSDGPVFAAGEVLL